MDDYQSEGAGGLNSLIALAADGWVSQDVSMGMGATGGSGVMVGAVAGIACCMRIATFKHLFQLHNFIFLLGKAAL